MHPDTRVTGANRRQASARAENSCASPRARPVGAESSPRGRARFPCAKRPMRLDASYGDWLFSRNVFSKKSKSTVVTGAPWIAAAAFPIRMASSRTSASAATTELSNGAAFMIVAVEFGVVSPKWPYIHCAQISQGAEDFGIGCDGLTLGATLFENLV